MSNPRKTSRACEALRQAKKLLANSAWPDHPHSGNKPEVDYTTQADLSQAGEHVQIQVDVEGPFIEWARAASGRDERFELVVLVRSGGWSDSDTALDRIEELADVTQRAFYADNDTSFPLPDRLDLGIYGVDLGGITSCAPVLYRDGNHVVAEAEIRYAVVAHI